jgi:hypothetical protein
METNNNLDLRTLNEYSAQKHYTKMKQTLDIVYAASKGLQVIDPDDKGADDNALTMARTAIAHAKRVFILGYGFDEHNNERLGLREYLANQADLSYNLVAFTNYQDRGQINKRASKVFYGHPKIIRSHGYEIMERYEKSIRNTYDALAWDFDLAD